MGPAVFVLSATSHKGKSSGVAYLGWRQTASSHAPAVMMGAANFTSYGRIASTRAGKPEPPAGFGNVTIAIAPLSGTLSRFASSSIW